MTIDLEQIVGGDAFDVQTMGWDPRELVRPEFLILSTRGGIRAGDGQPVALGHYTGHWTSVS